MDPAVELEESLLSRTKEIDNAIKCEQSDIQKFYENSVVFITGASGFLGKQLVEKLLRSCKIKKMYLLLRSKKGISFKDRLNDIFNDPVFDTIRKTKLNFENCIVAVDGNISSKKLGIRNEEWKTITDDVTVIFHVAATVKFDEHIKLAVETNVLGTKEVISLAKECKKLRSLVYVSTAYSHATKSRSNSEVLDQFYQTPADPEDLILMAQDLDCQDNAEGLTKTLLKDWPNTYCFTKAVAEELVRKADGLPACVVRPAIVTGAYKEPTPGWIVKSCVYGAGGLVQGTLLGVLHTVQARQSISMDIVPVDYVNNCVIAAGWKTALDWGKRDEKMVYPVACGRKNFLYGNFTSIMENEMKTLVSPEAISLLFCVQTPLYLVYIMLCIMLHFIPGAVFDGLALLRGEKPRLLQIYIKNLKIQKSLSYFTTNGWHFKDGNTVSLKKSMSKSDQAIFNFDMADVNMTELVMIWYVGLRKYVIKDGLKNTKLAVERQSYLKFKIAVLGMFFVLILVLRVFYFFK